MGELTLKDVSKKMSKIDICMMTTQAPNGNLTSRPMSNNGDVEYDGNSYFFTFEDTELVRELKQNDNMNLSFQGKDWFYISITGEGQLIKDKETLKEHWVPSLKRWFEDGVDTPGIIMVHVKAGGVKYWDGEEEGEVKF
jgi:general stress protein 26